MTGSRKPLVAGNWKMHKTVSEAVALVRDLRPRISMIHDVEVAVFPPFTALSAVAQTLDGSNLGLGAQDLHWEASGAFTGELSAAMLTDVGCRYVLVGHSERRQLFGETDGAVKLKAAAALEGGLIPIVCFGESLAEREASETLEVVERQVTRGVSGLPTEQVKRLVLAYEPVWAIGTGKTATSAQAQEVHAAVRGLMGRLHGPEVAASVRILYGGSVKPENARELMAQPDVDGALVGGASLSAESFAGIVRYRG